MEQLQSLSLAFKCDKAFDTLQPCEGGWYCDGCKKLVRDLRGKQETEIRDIYAANNYKLCGMFEADRIRVVKPLPKWRRWGAMAVLTLGFTGLHQALVAQHIPKKTISDTSRIAEENQLFGGVTEVMAEYPGGAEKWYRYLKENLVSDKAYLPKQKAFFTFIVEKDGSLTDIKQLRSPFTKEMNEKIIRLFEKSPKWKPGMQFGKPVRQQYVMPISLSEK